MVTHIVLFRFGSSEDAAEARRLLLTLEGRIPGMLGIEAGLDYVKSERSYDLGLITRHESREALEVYRTHPIHLEVAGFIKERSTAAAACDFEA